MHGNRETTEMSMDTTISKCIDMIIDALNNMKTKSARELKEAEDQASLTEKFYEHAGTILKLTHILECAGMM